MVSWIVDADVLLNVTLQEEETATGRPLWEAPRDILRYGTRGDADVAVSLTTLMEVRFVLRRKTDLQDQSIEDIIERIMGSLPVLVPDVFSQLRAYELQAEHPFDPFDALLLSQAMAEDRHLITRDRRFYELSNQLHKAANPEEAVEHIISTNG